MTDININDLESEDPDYIGDVTISLSENEMIELDEPEQDATKVLKQLQEVGGVNRDMAIAIESMQPGIITDRFPLNSFTREYTRTNYGVALESAELVALAARAALAIGVGVVAGMLASWLYDKFFGGKSGGGGGGGGDRDKSIREMCKDVREGRREMERVFREFKKHAGQLKNEEVKKIFGKDFIKFYNERWEKKGGYNKLIDEIGKGQGDHLKFIQQAVAKVPAWMTRLEEMQIRLSGLVDTGKTDDINIRDFDVKMELLDMTAENINQKLPALRAKYKEMTVKSPDLQPALDENFERAASYGAEFDKLKEEDAKKLKDFAEKTKAWGENLKKNPEKAKAYNDAAKQAQLLIRDNANRIGEIWGIMGMIQEATIRIHHVLGVGTVSLVTEMEKAAKELEKVLSETEMEEINGAMASMMKFFGAGTPFRVVDKSKEKEGSTDEKKDEKK